MTEYSAAVCSFYDDMLNFAIALHKHREDAEDTVQHVVMKFLEKDGRYEIEDLKKILMTAIKNRWRDLGRHNVRYVDVAPCSKGRGNYFNHNGHHQSDTAKSDNREVNTTDSYAMVMDIEDAVSSLQPELAKVIRLRIQGYQYDEIAKKLHYPMGTIKAHIFKARFELRKKM